MALKSVNAARSATHILEKEKKDQIDRIRSEALLMSSTLAKEKERLGVRLCSREVKELEIIQRRSGNIAKPRRRVVYNI